MNTTINANVQSWEDSSRIEVLDIKFMSVQEGVFTTHSCDVNPEFKRKYPNLLDKALSLVPFFPIGTDETLQTLNDKMINQIYQHYNNAWWFTINGDTVVDNS